MTGASIVTTGTPVAVLCLSDCLGTSVTNCGPPTLVTVLVASAITVVPSRSFDCPAKSIDPEPACGCSVSDAIISEATNF